jgi:hypothetical protein
VDATLVNSLLDYNTLVDVEHSFDNQQQIAEDIAHAVMTHTAESHFLLQLQEI